MSMPMRRSLCLLALLLATVNFGNAQDAASGEKIFNKCRPCHQVGEAARNSVGPTLNGLFGRKSGTQEGYNYSDANKTSGVTWDEPTFAMYIKDPKARIPGTKMAFGGIKNDDEIKDLTSFLKQFDKAGKSSPGTR